MHRQIVLTSNFLCRLNTQTETMIVVIGDSNYREICSTLKANIEAEVGEVVIFRQATTNESLKVALDEEEENGEVQKVILVSANLNEIATRAKGNKSRDEMVKTVVMEQNSAINKWAHDHQELLVLLTPPLYRTDPHWIEERLKWVHFCMRDDIEVYSPFNVQLGSSTDIGAIDLKADKVHLLDTGMSKVTVTMISDMKIALRDVEKLRAERMEIEGDLYLESSQLAAHPTRTPLTNKKRARPDDGAEKNLQKEKRHLSDIDRSEAMMERIDLLVKSIEQERELTLAKLKVCDQQQIQIVTNQKETDAKVDKLTDLVDSDSILFATMKEDIDAGENEQLKDSVVVKRMRTDLAIPTDKKILAKFVQTEGRKLVTKILGNDNSVKFVATLSSSYRLNSWNTCVLSFY